MSSNFMKFSLYCKRVLLLFFFTTSTWFSYAQNNVTVSGKVTDQDTKLPLGNVSVMLKGTSIGVVTSNSGDYTITVPPGATLVFSYLNTTPQEVKVTKQGSINVSISTAPKNLDEVVVIGYGSRKKKDVTGAISTVNSKDIEKSTSMTPELALQGKAAGVFIESGGGSPLARPTVRIRGVNTFGYAEPLYVVDGVPMFEGGSGITGGAIGDIRSPINIFSLINPADIESMTVLKDASSAAIYGVRASNGVILITTKKGRSGRPRVDVTSSYAIQNIAKKKAVLNTKQYFDLVQEAYSANPDANTSFAQKFGPLYDPSSSTYVGNGATYDWQDELKNKNAPIQDYNVKVSGGSDNVTYYFSGGYSKTESPLKGENAERYSVATNVEAKISKYVSAGLNIRLIKQTALDNTNASLPDMMSTIPFQPIYNSSDPTGFQATGTGTLIPNPDYDPSKLDPGTPFIFDSIGVQRLWGDQSRYNPFALQSLNKRSFDLLSFLGSAFVQIEPVTGLKIKGTLGGNYYLNFRREFSNHASFRFFQPPTNPYRSGMDAFAKGNLGERNTRTTNLNKELTVNYTHSFSDHSIDVILGASEQFGRWYVSDLSGQVNYTDPQYWAIANRPPNTNGFSSILQEDALIGYVGRVSYKYKDKYYLDATVRRDGSSRFAPGYKWDNFPSFAAAWRISSEKFFPQNSFINDLKLRAGWGKLGNFQSAPPYSFLSAVSNTPDYALGSGTGDGNGSPTNAVSFPSYPNIELTWESLKTVSFGFDASLLNNSVTLTAEYYAKTTSDIIQSVALPPNTGIQDNATLNVAEVKNSGIELQIGYNKKLGNINFNASANLTTVKNNVVKLNGGTPIGGEGGRIEQGSSMFYLWGYKVGGIFQNQAEIDAWRQTHADQNIGQVAGDPSQGYQYKPGDMYFQDVHGNPRNSKEQFSPAPDSVINSNDRTYLGKTIPGYYYGFSVGAEYKGLDFNIFFQGVGDVQKYNYIRSGLESMGGAANQWTTVLDRWTPTNPSAKMPRAVFGDPAQTGRFSSRYVENASYLRLKNVQLGYRIPANLLTKLGFIQNLRVYVGAVNLVTITGYNGLDPENEVLPPTRQILFGLNVGF
jgi:TonB-dependent starch-binding outer membrane protein SusC